MSLLVGNLGSGFRVPHQGNGKRDWIMAEDAKSVAEQVQEISERWNPKPTSEGVHAYIGEPVPEGDTRATNSGGDARPGSPLSSKVDASRLDLYGDDLDDEGDADLDDMDKAELQEEAEKRGLAKSGSKEDLKARIREHDAAGDGDDDEDDDEED